MKVLIADPISDEGIDILCSCAEVDIKTGLRSEEIISIIDDYEALVVRSQTKVTAKVIEAGKKLKVIARAGVGVDNIDVEEATRRGILVVNAPNANVISAAEHAIALMLALARHIPQANAVLKSGVWQRGKFMGTEVRGKTLGIIGLGKVGSAVAKRAQALEMKLIAYDPYITADYARSRQVELILLEQLLKESDFITLHLTLTPGTEGLIGAKELAMVKPTVRIINCARGGIIDEEALVKAVKEGRVAGAAIDVFSTEPATECVLFGCDNIIVTPHLGASTIEAQAVAAKDIAEQIVDVFNGRPARYAVNAPPPK
jgi:D-3-phosphoglycerate dehydrogenase